MPAAGPDEQAHGREGEGQFLSPSRLRQLLLRRGPIGVKVGQFLALRPDLIPDRYASELLRLVDQVPPFAWGTARRIITTDLGEVEALSWINPMPLAAGSLAQVHEGRGRDGRSVAIKVLRPDAREQIERGLPAVRRLARALQLAGVLHGLSAGRLVDEFARWLEEELDFEVELRNAERLFALNPPDGSVVVPSPRPELSGQAVVTTELLVGVPFTDLLRWVRAGEPERIADAGLDAVQLAERLLGGLLRQIFVDRVFHADPHPGNLLALDGNRVGMVDFGLVDELDAGTHRALTEYVSSVYVLDAERMARGALDLLVPGRHADPDGFDRDFVAAVRSWIETRGEERARGRTPVARLLVAALAAARANGYSVPPRLVSIYRALLIGESVAAELAPSTSLDSIGRAFFAELRVRDALDGLDPEQTMSRALQTLTLARDAPLTLGRLFEDLAEDRFVLSVRTSASREDRRHADQRSRLIGGCILVGALAVLVAGAPSGLLGGEVASSVFSVALLVLVGYVVLIWRSLR
ncbi:AarF/ABC1/UbiB kinase family protein [Solirubrobacter taibaiensis]|nr:AarF/ABC1/UbiB kinase family protein [Solirubrobacter taibaiensis]